MHALLAKRGVLGLMVTTGTRVLLSDQDSCLTDGAEMCVFLYVRLCISSSELLS